MHPDFLRLAELIHERTGLFYENSRSYLFTDKILPLIAARGFSTVEDFYYYLKYDPGADEEWRRVQTALAVNETYFFREYDQIRAAVEVIIPALQQKYPNRAVRIWHAACASGEEAYTMAISLEEAGRFLAGPIEITATDFNHVALQTARKGVFRQRAFRTTPPDIFHKYFTPVEKEQYQIAEHIRPRVNFTYLNLMDKGAMGLMVNYDIIFCRNVFIYFSDGAIRRVVEWFDHALRPEGTLFVASAESLLRLTTRLELVEIGSAFGYQKRKALE